MALPLHEINTSYNESNLEILNFQEEFIMTNIGIIVNRCREIANDITIYDVTEIEKALSEYLNLVHEIYEERNTTHLWEVLEELGFDVLDINYRYGTYQIKIVTDYGDGISWTTFYYNPTCHEFGLENYFNMDEFYYV